MNTTLRLALIALCALAMSGCALMSAEDQDFYGKGWINPRALDDGPRMPAHPETTGGLGGGGPVVDPILDE